MPGQQLFLSAPKELCLIQVNEEQNINCCNKFKFCLGKAEKKELWVEHHLVCVNENSTRGKESRNVECKRVSKTRSINQ